MYVKLQNNYYIWKKISNFSSDLVKTIAIDFDFEKLLKIFNSFDFDIGFDGQKWPIQLLILILTFKSDHPTIDFDVQKWPSNYWFWCSKVTSSNFWFWFWTLNPTFDHVWHLNTKGGYIY